MCFRGAYVQRPLPGGGSTKCYTHTRTHTHILHTIKERDRVRTLERQRERKRYRHKQTMWTSTLGVVPTAVAAAAAGGWVVVENPRVYFVCVCCARACRCRVRRAITGNGYCFYDREGLKWQPLRSSSSPHNRSTSNCCLWSGNELRHHSLIVKVNDTDGGQTRRGPEPMCIRASAHGACASLLWRRQTTIVNHYCVNYARVRVRGRECVLPLTWFWTGWRPCVIVFGI